MREVLTPALWACAGQMAIAATATQTRMSHSRAVMEESKPDRGRRSLTAADALENHAGRGLAHALRVSLGERREGHSRFARIGPALPQAGARAALPAQDRRRG
jgi:hypothetical protein